MTEKLFTIVIIKNGAAYCRVSADFVLATLRDVYFVNNLGAFPAQSTFRAVKRMTEGNAMVHQYYIVVCVEE